MTRKTACLLKIYDTRAEIIVPDRVFAAFRQVFLPFLRGSGSHGRMRADSDPRCVAAVQNYFEAVRGKNEERWLRCFCEDAVCHDPVGSMPVEGRDALREIWKVLTAPFKALSIVETDVFYAGSGGAAVYWSAHGTGVNDRTVDFSGITILELATDGRIQTAMSYWDPGAVLIKLAGEDPEAAEEYDPALRN